MFVIEIVFIYSLSPKKILPKTGNNSLTIYIICHKKFSKQMSTKSFFILVKYFMISVVRDCLLKCNLNKRKLRKICMNRNDDMLKLQKLWKKYNRKL